MFTTLDNNKSTTNKNMDNISDKIKTTTVEPFNSCQVGQDTFFISKKTPSIKPIIFLNILYSPL